MAHKKSVSKETHQSIAEQTRSFLKSGGKIEQVPTGHTGQEKLTAKKGHFQTSPSGQPIQSANQADENTR